MRFSEKYRKQEQLKEGQQVWNELDAKLPKLTGEKSNDDYRIIIFKSRVCDISAERRTALRAWVNYQVHDLKYNFTEHTTATIEEIESKLLATYERHKNALDELKEHFGL